MALWHGGRRQPVIQPGAQVKGAGVRDGPSVLQSFGDVAEQGRHFVTRLERQVRGGTHLPQSLREGGVVGRSHESLLQAVTGRLVIMRVVGGGQPGACALSQGYKSLVAGGVLLGEMPLQLDVDAVGAEGLQPRGQERQGTQAIAVGVQLREGAGVPAGEQGQAGSVLQ